MKKMQAVMTGLLCFVAQGAHSQSFEQQAQQISQKLSGAALQARQAMAASQAAAAQGCGEGCGPGAISLGFSAETRVMTLNAAAKGGSTLINVPCADLYPGYNPVDDMHLFVNRWKVGESFGQKYRPSPHVAWRELNKANVAPPEKIDVHFFSPAGLDSLSGFTWKLVRSHGTNSNRPYSDSLGIEWRIRSVADANVPSGNCDPTKDKCSNILEAYWQGKKVVGIYTVVQRDSENSITQTFVNPVTDDAQWNQLPNKVGEKYCSFLKAYPPMSLKDKLEKSFR